MVILQMNEKMRSASGRPGKTNDNLKKITLENPYPYPSATRCYKWLTPKNPGSLLPLKTISISDQYNYNA